MNHSHTLHVFAFHPAFLAMWCMGMGAGILGVVAGCSALVLPIFVADMGLGVALVFATLGIFFIVFFLTTMAVSYRAIRRRLTVTTLGLDVRGLRRTRFIPWSSVAWIDSDEGWFYRGSAVIVTHAGERITARITSNANTWYRGEPLKWSNTPYSDAVLWLRQLHTQYARSGHL